MTTEAKHNSVAPWRLTAIDGETLAAENGESTVYVRGEHCRACALTRLLVEHGGRVDLRGLSGYGPCYQMLAVTTRAARDPEAPSEPEAGSGDNND